MTEERRETIDAVIDSSVLSDEERISLISMEKFGWEVWFVREAKTDERMVVLRHPDHGKVGTLTRDGWNGDADITIRSDD